MKEIQYEIVKEIAVLSTGDSGYTKEINLISWNGKEPKYDIRSFSPNREKCGNVDDNTMDKFTYDGFYRTGDKAIFNEYGEYEIIGRIVDQINRAGEKINPQEIEKCYW